MTIPTGASKKKIAGAKKINVGGMTNNAAKKINVGETTSNVVKSPNTAPLSASCVIRSNSETQR